MAGTLTISTLSDGTNSTSSTNCIQGSAKAWCNFNGATVATSRASYNVSSLTRNSQGNYTVAFTNALADANYAVTVTTSSDQNGSNWTTTAMALFTTNAYNYASSPQAPTASGFRFGVGSSSGSGVSDPTYVCFSVFR